MTRILAATALTAAALAIAGCSGTESETAAPVPGTTVVTPGPTSTTATASKVPTGKDFYIQACADMTEYFDYMRQLAGEFGETWDPSSAANEMLELMKTDPEVMEAQTAELNASIAELNAELGIEPTEPASDGTSDGPTWHELNKDQQFQLERAVRAAAAGDC